MPSIFNFHCNKCSKGFEQLVHPSGMVVMCPECESEDVTKQITSFRIKSNEPWKMAGQRLK